MGRYRAIGKFISAILTGPVSASAQTSSRRGLTLTPRVARWLSFALYKNKPYVLSPQLKHI